MTELNVPSPANQESPFGVLEPDFNPFAGAPSIEQHPSKLELGGSILDSAGVRIPTADTGPRQEGETYGNVEEAAKKACSLIAGMFVTEGSPDELVFPKCNDMDVISQSLKQLKNTALGLGYGPFPPSVPKAWTRFMHETTQHYRSSNGLEIADLVPLKLEIPRWLATNPNFDILPNCELMDIVISGNVNSLIAEGAKNCRITFTDAVYEEAIICAKAQRCTVSFKSSMSAKNSFQGAQNMSVQIHGDQRGTLGTMRASRVDCDGVFSGTFNYKEICSYGYNVKAQYVT